MSRAGDRITRLAERGVFPRHHVVRRGDPVVEGTIESAALIDLARRCGVYDGDKSAAPRDWTLSRKFIEGAVGGLGFAVGFTIGVVIAHGLLP